MKNDEKIYVEVFYKDDFIGYVGFKRKKFIICKRKKQINISLKRVLNEISEKEIDYKFHFSNDEIKENSDE